MTGLTYHYAHPDHLVVKQLIPNIETRYLEQDEAVARIRARTGHVPIAIDPSGTGRIYWADIGDHRLREWQFIYSIKYLVETNAIHESFSTDMAILRRDDLLTDSLEPTAFVFHISRSGSTLLAKSLAKAAGHLVVNQGGPLQRGFWCYLTKDWHRRLAATQDNLAMFKRLVLALTRRRHKDDQRAFVKFISWNVVYSDFIRQAFPNVPSIFLYREPAEVIASIAKETTAALVAKGTRQAGFLARCDSRDTVEMHDVDYLSLCFEHYFDAALSNSSELHFLNYTELTIENFPHILKRCLGYTPTSKNAKLMRSQFAFNAKDDQDQVLFRDDSDQKRRSIDAKDIALLERRLGSRFRKLERSPRNFSTSLTPAVVA